MTDVLIVWAALGPIVAFVAGAVVVAWWDDDEDDDLPRDPPRRTDGAGPGLPGQVPFHEPYGGGGSAWGLLPGPAAGYSGQRAIRSCLQCGRREEWP